VLARVLAMLALVTVLATNGQFVDAAEREGAWGRNKQMYAVPAPEHVKIDGDLSDWDKSGGIEVFVAHETRAIRSIRPYVMYDDDALYVGADVKDTTPMVNAWNPIGGAGKAWDSDAFQMRLYLKPTYPGIDTTFTSNVRKDPDIVHLLAWYYTAQKLSCLKLDYSLAYIPKPGLPDGLVGQDQFAAGYKAYADGTGYSFEYRIPWKTLSGEYKLKAGDVTAATLQAQWGTADGSRCASGAWAYDLQRRGGFAYQESTCWGKLIFSEKGNLPPELTQLGVAPAPPAPLRFDYELPRDATVTLALMDERGWPVRHLVTAAERSAGKVTEAWDGLDDKGDPLPAGTHKWKAIYRDPIKLKYKLSVHNSGNPGYPTEDGRGSWGADHGLPSAVARAGQWMLLGWSGSECGWSLIATDTAGRKQWGQRYEIVALAADNEYGYLYGGVHGQTGLIRVGLANGGHEPFDGSKPWAGLPAGTKKVAGLAVSGKLLLASCRGAKNQLALLDKKTGLLVRSIELAGGEIGAIAAKGEQEVLVVLDGKVVVVNLESGQARSFANEHMDHPTGLAVGKDGKVYVANRGALQSMTVFDGSGRYLRSIGTPGGRPTLGKWNGAGVFNAVALALDAQDQLWVAEETNTPKRFSVWDTGSGQLVKDYFGASHYSTFVAMDADDPTRIYCHAVQWKVDLDKGTSEPEAIVFPRRGFITPFTVRGKQYATMTEENVDGVFLLVRDGDVFKPMVRATNKLWTDRNGDFQQQPDETVNLAFTAHDARARHIDRDFRIFWAPGYESAEVFMLQPKEILPNGVPTYDVSQVKRIMPGQVHNAEFAGLVSDGQEQAIYLANGERQPKPGQGSKFPGLNKYSFDGKHLWGYRKVVSGWKSILHFPVPEKGEAWGICSAMGKAGDFVATQSYFGSADIWTSDGLYVDKIFKDQRLGESGNDVINAEWFCGQFVRLKDGRYMVLAGDSDGRVNEIIGLDSIRRLEGVYTLTDDDVARAAKAVGEYKATTAKAAKLVIHPLANLNWENATKVGRKLDEKRGFNASLAYDAASLVAHYEVDSPSELTSLISEPQLIFRGGNCIDIELQTDPAVDSKRKEAGLGDVRLIVTRREGKPVCIGYFKRIKDFAGEPVTLQSPTGKELFDKIEQIPVELAYEKHPSGGFSATVKIPLKALGLQLKTGSEVRLDLGYRFGNQTGSTCAQRAYWSNQGATAAIIYDVPSETRLEPAEWGTATVE
jgi:hypothetical protein